MKLFSTFKRLFRRKKKEETPKPDPFSRWRKPGEKRKKNPTSTSQRLPIKPKFFHVPHIPHINLVTAKRFLALVCFVVNSFFGIASMISSDTLLAGVMFVLNSLICLDYTIKSRRVENGRL